jgi:hypothetical protein
LHDTSITFGISCAVLDSHLISCALDIDRWSLNGEGLSRTCLTICKDGTVISLHAAICDGFGYLIEHGLLLNVFLSNKIKMELLDVKSSLQQDGPILDLDALCFTSAAFLFPIIQWPHSDHYLDIVLRIARVKDILFNIHSLHHRLRQKPRWTHLRLIFSKCFVVEAGVIDVISCHGIAQVDKVVCLFGLILLLKYVIVASSCLGHGSMYRVVKL